MANDKFTAHLAQLVNKAGGARKAVLAIKELTGVSPSKSSIDRAIKGSCSDYTVHCLIRDLTEATSSWFMFETNTHAWDGHYRNLKDAQYSAGFKTAKWKGSNWVVMSSINCFLKEEQFHTKPESQEKLISAFGEPDYKSADKYDADNGKF
ncbi:hypothetical protein OTK49_02850 [Vibrio coralliirubri]|uniref:hypothetical protein n=1 Tax=Vibrio coralliirubri TaxID=1516159 RepID=UPI002284CFE5|nr:hypothetical protein [Vibrio coralliirubri]MCY9861457.1 hypothetical protein [Vibrio coralliirubri]